MPSIQPLEEIEKRCISNGLSYEQFICELVENHREKVRDFNNRHLYYNREAYNARHEEYWTENRIKRKFSKFGHEEESE